MTRYRVRAFVDFVFPALLRSLVPHQILTLPLQLALELEYYSPKLKSKEPLSIAQLAVTSTFLA
jgi:hypothetical protein